MKTRWMAIVLAAALWACNGSGSPAPALQMATLGEVADAVEAAATSPMPGERADTDGDTIPDVVELALRTDPDSRDTDGDGLVDSFELFGTGYDPAAPLPDKDRDGLIDPLDNDDDGDLVNDGCTVDTDGDGVPNCLEYYGYAYDFQKAEFIAWDGDPAKPHFFTDPLQPSTDQDAYPDGMEVSRLKLDPTIRGPGDDPLVPAYPNIVCELASYTVTLNEEIRVTQSESLSKGRSWTRQTQQSHSHSVQNTWEIGGQYEFGPEGGATVSAKYGQTYEDTNSTTTSVATGESVTSEQGWSEARSMNPTDAARLKLFLKVKNRGTAPVSNLVPTLSLKIGGLSVATFEPAGANVQLLVPGETYPADPASYWVVDAKSTGAPLSLTMAELRALERGAPVSIAVTQTQGDAMQLLNGAWTTVGDTNEFTARCDAVCANLRIEMDNGDLVHHLVYADDTPSAPPMTLEEALAKLGMDADGNFHYLDANGTPRVTPLDGFTFAVDPPTLRANGWTLAGDGAPATTAPPGFSLEAMRLLPFSSIFIRAPRGPAEPPGPVIFFAFLDPRSGEVGVSATDYEGIQGVVVRNDDASHTQQLWEDVPGAGFFSGNALGEDGFEPGTALTVEVTNLAGVTAAQELGELFVEPEPKAPVIHTVELNIDKGYVYANVESGNPDVANSEVAWVRAFHTDFSGGVAEMTQVIDFFRDPNGYSAALPPGFRPERELEVVAYVSPGVWTSRIVSASDVTETKVRRYGTVEFFAMHDKKPFTMEWTRTGVTFDAAPGANIVSVIVTNDAFGSPAIPGIPTDVTLQNDGVNNWAFLYWNAFYTKVSGGNAGVFDALTRDDIPDDGSISARDSLKAGDASGIEVGDVLKIRTNPENLPGKLFVESIAYDHNIGKGQYWCTVRLRYVIYEKP
ncbi:MAG TPA: binary toxin-like calcium binding domain-containing protein [Planctomycetota bacterium]|nr:binary toxin-like calcium binding domain-containing protein [Planctomycetota bacterium]